jgi:hypothetical protein
MIPKSAWAPLRPAKSKAEYGRWQKPLFHPGPFALLPIRINPILALRKQLTFTANAQQSRASEIMLNSLIPVITVPACSGAASCSLAQEVYSVRNSKRR